MDRPPEHFWSLDSTVLLDRLATGQEGLAGQDALQRLSQFGRNLLRPKRRTDIYALLIAQFNTPIILILVAAAVIAFILGDRANPPIILGIVIVSGLLGFWQERGAARATEKLLAIVQVETTVQRDGKSKELPVEEVVPGDIVILSAGDVVPGDGRILEANDLFVDEATLTGETYPAEKAAGVVPEDTPLGRRGNCLFMGTHVISGTGRAVVVNTGKETEFGKVAERLRLRPPETEFEHGIRRFGMLLVEITVLLVVFIFVVNVYFKRPVLESFLFSAALAVGLTPQLLPAIISVNLAHGARRMAEAKVIVKRLAAIENFGSMDVLCADKTGTVTQGKIDVQSAIDMNGSPCEKVRFYAYLNAYYETGFYNPIDEALRRLPGFEVGGFRKLDEIPYSFVHKRLSVLTSKDGTNWLITKGALSSVLPACAAAETADGMTTGLAQSRATIEHKYEELSGQGYRLLAVAYRKTDGVTINESSLADMTFLGFLVLVDPVKPDIALTLADLKRLGVSFKIVTGDNRLVTASVCQRIGMENARITTATELGRMSDEALTRQVAVTDAFAEVEPNQKERIILALKKAGHVTGYMGDGINDASALHAADVGISVDNAVDVAKDAADIVLLEKDVEVLVEGVRLGRATFANTLKYVFMAASANFGNMFSMAGASLFLPFLPLLPTQILLMNILTDLPEMAIASDAVDPEMVMKPRRWDIRFIRNFMLVFGSLSSVFDYVTFGVLLLVLHAGINEFRAGWFIESVVSAAMVVLVVRTRRAFFRSRPGRLLFLATLLVVALAFIFPYTPLGAFFHFLPPPVWFLGVVVLIIVAYILSAELTKRAFYRWEKSW